MKLYCCGCRAEVEPRLTSGQEIYPHRGDLARLPFWKCDTCGNHVGCHHKSADPLKPLGIIPTAELRQVRARIHAVLDPLWQSGKVHRGVLYARLSCRLGYEYHTANLRTLGEAEKVLRIAESWALLAAKKNNI